MMDEKKQGAHITFHTHHKVVHDAGATEEQKINIRAEE